LSLVTSAPTETGIFRQALNQIAINAVWKPSGLVSHHFILINTGLKPGGGADGDDQAVSTAFSRAAKPLKWFHRSPPVRAGLKPGVNENPVSSGAASNWLPVA
jgi:hypothetical protein